MLYNPRAFITHTALLRQAFAHCTRFPTAASRRSLDRVSVPVWLIILSDQLPIVALVSLYLTNRLMGREPIPRQELSRRGPPFLTCPGELVSLSGISSAFALLSPTSGYVTHAILTRSPLY